jgi:short-subunit dehydrogenase
MQLRDIQHHSDEVRRLGKGWALVTGASSGIGFAFAMELARSGHPVLAVARRRERLERLASEAAAFGGRIEPLTADLLDPTGVQSVADRAAELDVELLVNNAGFASYGAFAELPLERELDLIRLNITAVVDLTHRLLPALMRRGRGGVINVASEMALQPMPYFASYAASKAFVLSFSEALAEELRGSGVRITAIAPGFVRTEFADIAGSRRAQGPLPHLTPERVVAVALRAYDRGRVVKTVGAFYTVLSFMARVAPRALMRRLLGRLMKPAAGGPVNRTAQEVSR